MCCALFSGHLINSGVKQWPEGIEGTRMEKGVWILSIWDSHIEGAEGTAVTETELVSNQEALSNFWRVVLPWFRHGSCSCKAQDCCFLKVVWMSLLAMCCALFSGHLINSGVKHLPEGIEGTRMEKCVWIFSIWDSHIEDGEGMAVTETEQVSNQEALSNFWRVVLPWFRHGSCSCKAQDCCFPKVVWMSLLAMCCALFSGHLINSGVKQWPEGIEGTRMEKGVWILSIWDSHIEGAEGTAVTETELVSNQEALSNFWRVVLPWFRHGSCSCKAQDCCFLKVVWMSLLAMCCALFSGHLINSGVKHLPEGIEGTRMEKCVWILSIWDSHIEDGEGMAVTETEQVSNQEALSNFWRVVLPWFRHGSCSCKAQDCCFPKVVWMSLLAMCCALFSGHLINSGVKHLPEGIEGTRMEKCVWILSICDSHIEGAEGTAVTKTELVSNQEALSNFWRVVLPWFRHGSCSCKAQDCCFLK